MTISDDQLMLLEQLTYLNSDVANAAGIGENYRSIENFKDCTVEKFLSQFSDDVLNELEKKRYGAKFFWWEYI